MEIIIFLSVKVTFISDRSLNLFYPQNGICNQKYNFWPKNYGEKWSRKIYFEIPPCGSNFITEFVILDTFMK